MESFLNQINYKLIQNKQKRQKKKFKKKILTPTSRIITSASRDNPSPLPTAKDSDPPPPSPPSPPPPLSLPRPPPPELDNPAELDIEAKPLQGAAKLDEFLSKFPAKESKRRSRGRRGSKLLKHRGEDWRNFKWRRR